MRVFVVRDLVAVARRGEARQAPVYGAWALAFALAGLVVYFAALMCTHLAAFRTATNMLRRRSSTSRRCRSATSPSAPPRAAPRHRRVHGAHRGRAGAPHPDFVGALVHARGLPRRHVRVRLGHGPRASSVLASAFCMFLMMGGGLGGKDGEGNSNAMQFMVNYQNALDKMNKAAVEYVRGIPVVKVFQQTVHSFRAFRESIVAYCDFATAYVKLCEGPQVAQLVAINATFFVLVPAGILLAGA
ncbi:MAG: ABC transporter ATP-binding protein, partial [Eggerthellaceae bacterium]